MMRLAALKTGFGVPEADFTGEVHAVFNNACILAVAGAGLTTLVPARAGGLPGGITIDAAGELGLDRRLARGARAAARAGILRIADGGLTVDLRGATPWRSRLGELDLDMERAESRAAWETAAGILAADRRAEKLARIAGGPIAALLGAARQGAVADATAAAEGLVGLGEGGTPAGDDFLTGLMAALHAAAGGEARRRAFVATFGAHLRRIAGRTNAVSRVYLEAAAAGEVSEKLTLLAGRIAEGAAPVMVGEAAAAAIAVGHTSGADGTLGLLAGMAAWGPSPLPAAATRLMAGTEEAAVR